MYRKLFLIVILLSAVVQQAQWAEANLPQQPAAEPPPQTSVRAPIAKTAESSLTINEFAQLSEKLSEQNGFFDTDNLISNEASYLHVLGKMRQMKISGGAYLGVGPDQNFSYIALVRPSIVFIVDIRRDNLLQQLLFKSIFTLARNRLEFLCLLFGKPAPVNLNAWDHRSIQEIIEYLDKSPAKREQYEKTKISVREKILSFGIKLDQTEIGKTDFIHSSFIDAGLDLKFTSRNRPPRYYYPSYRDLLLEKDLSGKLGNYLVSEEDFQFLKSLEARNLIIPVVGNLAGEHALKSVGKYLTERGERVSTFYTSNVEFYLMRGDDFDRFAENVKSLPRDDKSVIIRSYFNGTWGYPHPQSVTGYYSTQLLQTIDSFIKEHASGGYRSYTDVVSKHILELR